MESQILFFSGVSIVAFFIIGMFAGWFLNVVYGSGSFYVQNNGGTNCSGTWLAMRY